MSFTEFIETIPDYLSTTQRERVKFACYYQSVNFPNRSFDAKIIRALFHDHDVTAPTNIPRELVALKKSKNLICVSGMYRFDVISKSEVFDKVGVSEQKKSTTIRLNSLLDIVKTDVQRNFLKEAIQCFNKDLFRSSIIMTWLLAIDTLYEFTIANKLIDFNKGLVAKSKKKMIANKSDFEDYNEGEIIEVMKSAGIISKEQRKILVEKLDVRNSAAHPNTTSFREAKVSTFIEELVEDIISKF